MKRIISRLISATVAAAAAAAVATALATAVVATAQQQQPTQLQLSSPAPASVSGESAVYAGAPFTGAPGTIYYWVIARYPSGTAVPAGPAVAYNTPGFGNLSATRYVTVSWLPVTGATGYDVVTSSNNSFPANPNCASCAVVLNTPSIAFNDTGAAGSAYPVAGVPTATAATAILTLNNVSEANPFISMQVFSSLFRIAPLSGGYTIGDCVKIGAGGVLVDSGSPSCSTGPGASITRGTWAARPACTAANTLYVPTDSKYQMSQCDGTAWADFLPGGTVATFAAPPTVWRNQNGASVSSANGGEYLTIPINGGIITLREETISGNFTRTAYISPILGQFNNASMQFCLTDGTKLECLDVAYSGQLFTRVSRWTNANTFLSTVWPAGLLPPFPPYGGFHFRVSVDAVNINWFIGDGVTFTKVYSEARGAFLGTIASVGYGAYPDTNLPIVL